MDLLSVGKQSAFSQNGRPHVPFWCNSTFLDDYFDRLYCKETLQQFKDLGITCIATSFYKGYGLETEEEEIVRQAKVVKMAHDVGLKVLGYVNSDACYYEMLFKELPHAKEMLQRDVNGNWRNPNKSYYPHKANKRLSICSKEDLIYLNSAGMSRLQYSKIVLLKGNKGFLFNDYSGDCAQFYLDGEIYEGFLCCFRAKTKSIQFN